MLFTIVSLNAYSFPYGAKITQVWNMGFRGRGVTIAVVDTGTMSSAADVACNFNPVDSINVSIILRLLLKKKL